jgi:hypothetical protein
MRLAHFDIILTTYATVASEFSNNSSVLYRITFFRLVLDEGTSLSSGPKHR